MGEQCWNCLSKSTQVRSVITGNVYCTSCGAALDGLGAVTDLDLIATEQVPRNDEGKADLDN